MRSQLSVPCGIRLWKQNVAGRRSGRVTEHIKTHTHTPPHTRHHTHRLPVGQTRSLRVPASHTPPPYYMPKPSRADERLKEEEKEGHRQWLSRCSWDTKSKRKKGEIRTKVCSKRTAHRKKEEKKSDGDGPPRP